LDLARKQSQGRQCGSLCWRMNETYKGILNR